MAKTGKSQSKIEQHIARWHLNRDYLETLDPCLPEWAVTVAFYACLHGVQAYLLRGNYDAQSHTKRNDRLNVLGHTLPHGPERDRVRALAREYNSLRAAALHARYEPQVTKYCSMPDVQKEIVADSMAEIEKILKRLLGNSAVGILKPITLQSCSA